jgi:MEMO1 family protein
MPEVSPQELARDAVETYVLSGQVIAPPPDIGPLLARQAGSFVCLKRAGQLRGCIGTIQPCRANLADEIIHNAVQAAVADPRFFPVDGAELAEIQYSVDVLSEPEPIEGIEDLDPKVYGCIVTSADGGRRGLLLPDLEGVDTAEQQVAICRQKGGIPPLAPVRLERFTVTRYEEK